MASHINPMTSNLRIPSFIVAFLRVFRCVVHYAQGRRQLRGIWGSKLKSGGQSWKPALNLTQTFIIPELDWGKVLVKIMWSQKKKKKKKVFAEIRRLFLAEITNSNGFSGQKQQPFPSKKNTVGGKK